MSRIEHDDHPAPHGVEFLTPKLGIIVGILAIPLTIFTSRFLTLFHGVFIGSLLFVVALIISILSAPREGLQRYWVWLLLTVIGFGIFVRYYQFRVPASLVGSDPDQRAIWIRHIIRMGDLTDLSAGFYSDAPTYLIHGATSQLVTDLPRAGLGTYAVLLGVFIPVTGFIIGKQVSADHGLRVGLLTAVVANVISFTVKLGFWPIPQIAGVILLVSSILVIHQMANEDSKRLIFLILLLGGVMIITHKVQLFFLVGALVLIAILERLFSHQHQYQSYIEMVQSVGTRPVSILSIGVLIAAPWMYLTSLFSPTEFQLIVLGTFGVLVTYSVVATSALSRIRLPATQPVSFTLLLIVGMLFVFQVFFVSDFISVIVAEYLIKILTGFSVTAPPVVTDPEAASRIDYRIYSIFMHRGPSLMLVLFTAFSAATVLLYNLRDTRSIRLIAPLLFVLALTPMSISAVTSTTSAGGIGVQRLLPAFVPIIAAVICAQCAYATQNDRFDIDLKPKYAVAVVLIIFCLFQVGSPLYSPDHPMQQRQYLAADEVAGKEFTNAHAQGLVHTDDAYALESIAPVKPIGYVPHGNPRTNYFYEIDEPIYVADTNAYLTGVLGERGEENILYRQNIEYYPGPGGLWRLNHPPGIERSQQYHSIYDNNGVTVYHRLSS